MTRWVDGAVLAGSACQVAVLAAVLPLGLERHALRQRLREWRSDGADRAAPWQTSLAVCTCFAALLRWVLAWWPGTTLPLAISATTLADKVVMLTVSVLDRGGAIPVAWHVLPANRKGAWMPPVLALPTLLGPAVPAELTILVQTDRGLWSNRLWDGLRALGWHPLMRVRREATFRPAGAKARVRATSPVPGPGHAWVGPGTACKHRRSPACRCSAPAFPRRTATRPAGVALGCLRACRHEADVATPWRQHRLRVS